MRFATLKTRGEFLKVRNKGKSVAKRSFVVQYFFTPGRETPDFQVGVTATKRIGNAVIRNRCKRRLRALVRSNREKVEAQVAVSMDMVLIARYTTPTVDYKVLEKEFLDCLKLIATEAECFGSV